MITFAELGLSELALTSLSKVGYTHPTDIQTRTIGVVAEGRDAIVSAETGSGKTAAFALPIIERLGHSTRTVRALVLVPTRELALQVKEQFLLLSQHTKLRTIALYGGTGMERQTRALRQGADIVVATPGRLIDFLQRRTVSLKDVQMFVLDEADRLLDMGFMPQVSRVMSQLPAQKQSTIFSATIDGRIQRIAENYMKAPVLIRANQTRIEPAAIEQRVHFVHEFDKDRLLLDLIRREQGAILVFTQTRRRATWVVDRLREAQVQAEEIHGDIKQSQRERTMDRYRSGQFAVLVATDVAARGLDIPSIMHVINYDLPQSSADYVHRIGRTGRAGRSGIAHSFVSDEQRELLRDIERIIGRKLGPEEAPKPLLKRRPPPGRRRA